MEIIENPRHRLLDGDSQLPSLARGLRLLDRCPPTVACATGGTMIVLIGIVGHITGPLLSSSLFYLIPVLFITHVAGLRAGVIAAVSAALMWLAADINTRSPLTHPVIPFWNAGMRLGTFLVAVGLVSAMRSLNAHLEDRVAERTAALEAQIDETRGLEKTILEISDLERSKIGQDLHDGLCQQLVSAAFSINLLQKKLETTSPSEIKEAEKIADMIDDSINQARNLARGLYPVRLETEGLEMALRELASTMTRRFGIECKVICPEPVLLYFPASDIHLYRIAQEAVVNAAKHARCSQVLINLENDKGSTMLKVADNGIGMGNSLKNNEGMGIRIMQYRSRMIFADFKISQNHPQGTSVECRLNREDLP